jgi:hypothetical protein
MSVVELLRIAMNRYRISQTNDDYSETGIPLF